ncbi:MAG: hypothetical protein WB347_10840, partial [Terriglobales bacterium]
MPSRSRCVVQACCSEFSNLFANKVPQKVLPPQWRRGLIGAIRVAIGRERLRLFTVSDEGS